MNTKIEVERESIKNAMKHLKGGSVIGALNVLEEILRTPLPMTEEDWQRVVDEGFYVHAKYNPSLHFRPTEYVESIGENHEVVREKGLRQPHFKGHSHPEGAVMVAVYYYGQDLYTTDSSRFINWDGVREYIIL